MTIFYYYPFADQYPDLRSCLVWCGVVWCGVVWCGVVWCVWCGVVWCGVVWCGVVWCGVVCVPTQIKVTKQCRQTAYYIMQEVVWVNKENILNISFTFFSS